MKSLKIVWPAVSSLLLISGVDGRGQAATPAPQPATPPAATQSASALTAKPPKKKPEFPPYQTVFQGYKEVVSKDEKRPSLISIWVRPKDGQMLAALSPKFTKQKFFIALTVASGERFAGLQAGDLYAYWRRYDKRLALITPNLSTRSMGDAESKRSVKRLFTDRVILDVPIVTMLPKWGPVIDMDNLLVAHASKFFGSSVRGANPKLASIKTSKAFPDNVELAFEVPVANGQLKTLHYSFSVIPVKGSYKTRVADERVGYFTTTYTDLGKYQEGENQVRFINRWHLEKADPKLQRSPVKNPIIFYLEATTPIRYRRWVRHGVLMWNKAFEQVGLDNAIEVRYQDAATGAHMEKDPEDVRYNFIRWLNNNIGTAIGPSRVNPMTGQILDADIILTDGWIRHYWRQFNEILPDIAMEGFAPETYAWLEQHPEWDPRITLAPPAERARLLAEQNARGARAMGGHPMATVDPTLIGDNEYDGLVNRVSQVNGLCRAADCKALDLALMRMDFDLLRSYRENEDAEEGEEGDPEKDKKEPKKIEETLDGIPEWFIGPLLAELVAHEVGHTLGLRHNFKSSSIYDLEKINSNEVKDKKPFAGSVMDYLPVNIFMDCGSNQGDYAMIGIGPYDEWAIQYGYTIAAKPEALKKILARVAEPTLQYATDEDTYGPDPLARRYDFGKDPLKYAATQMALAQHHRSHLLEKYVKDGQSWAKARHGYELTLALQSRSLSMMANWIGGAFVNRDKKGDPNERPPLQVVPAEDQRAALEFVINNAFEDDAFGLTPELLTRMSVDKWLDDFASAMEDATWPVHDRISGIRSMVLTMLLNPSTLGRIYDNEFLVPAKEDMITIPELMEILGKSIWSELNCESGLKHTARRPMISSLRRSLQRDYVDRLISLSLDSGWWGPSSKTISNLARMHLSELQTQIESILEDKKDTLDAYSKAHLMDANKRIDAVLRANYLYRG